MSAAENADIQRIAPDTANALIDRLRACGSVAVALSGGVDSAVLAKAASLALGARAVAVTLTSPFLSAVDEEDAKAVATSVGIRHILLPAHDLAIDAVATNGKDRCYHCKYHRLTKLVAFAAANDIAHVVDGTNVDDCTDDRPGMRALAAFHPTVISPLRAAGWGKAQIRAQAKAWDLPVWEKPSAACLASRIARDIPLTCTRLTQVERAEHVLRAFVGSTAQLRVRHHGDLACIEASPSVMSTLFAHRAEIVRICQTFGFSCVTLDLAGYHPGGAQGDA